MVRSGMDEIKASIARHIRTNFDFTKVNGLTGTPAITQNPTRQTQTPRIYVYADGQIEIDSTKEDVPIEYTVNVEVLVRYNQYRGGNRQAHQMLDEIIGTLRGIKNADYPAVNGYTIYRIQFGDVVDFRFIEEGQSYFKVLCPFHISACKDVAPDQALPVQTTSYNYSNDWMFAPTNNNIERWDTGDILPVTTYPSGNNGWNFVDANFAISSGSGGTLVNNVYSLPSGVEPISLDSTLRYTLDADPTETTSLTATTGWRLIDSIRYGAKEGVGGAAPVFTDNADADFGLRLLSNWNIEYGTVHPHNETVTINGNADEYVYIIIDHLVTLTQIRNDIGQNVIAQFDVTTVGDYKIYINTQPIVFDGFSTDFTLIAN